MTKMELVTAIADEAGVSKVEAKKTVDAIIKVISGSICAGEKVSVSGFGTFIVAKKAARVGRNPRTGAQIKIPAKNYLKFTPSSEINTKLK